MKNQTNLINLSKISFSILILFLTLAVSCKKEETVTTDAEYRSVAWNYLNETQKTTVTGDWKIAPVTYEQHDNQEMAVVMFNTTQDALLGPIFVYISVKTKTVSGIGPRF